MVDDISLAHPQGLWHPIQEGDITPSIKIDESLKNPTTVVALAHALDVPFGVVNAISPWLDPDESEAKKEEEGKANVDEGRDTDVLQRRHWKPRRRSKKKDGFF